MVSLPMLQQPVIDAVDIRSVAEFYRELLGLHYRTGDEPADGREPDSADWLVLLDDDGRRVLTFQRTEELKPSTWPSPEVPMQLHLDFTVSDRDSLDAAHDHALRLGGRLVLDRSDDEDEPLYVFADPAGHPFCVFVG
ncbi:VOC family protein [Micrococcus sp. HSID17245]|uniref:VOC family protein n=1 Tax=Micrococcus sp. HSID17245 TaxID=2419508 RepID=UPI000F8663D8|nr:VOC family protein [Micrococcus sp. HSID17245]RUQ27494.1 VOC family protein [Micrococcus sp. HSID17245]